MARTFILSLLIFVPASARADIAPDPDYVETCTLARQARPDRSCVLCAAYHADPDDKCAKEVGPGFTWACRTQGASAWHEVWCKSGTGTVTMGEPSEGEAPTPTPAATQAPPERAESAPKTSGICALGTPGLRGAHALSIALAAAIGLLISRRRKR